MERRSSRAPTTWISKGYPLASEEERLFFFFFFSKLISRGGNYAPMIYRVTDDRYAHNYDYPFNSIVENIMQY